MTAASPTVCERIADMKKMLTVLMAGVICLAGASSALAAKSAGATSRPGKGHMACHRGKMLNLTADQEAQIKAIVTQARADAKAATDKQAKLAVWKAAREKIRTTVLTDAQRQQIDQWKASHHKTTTAPAPKS
jgi:Spy/CpxP family protein refolding chaperone